VSPKFGIFCEFNNRGAQFQDLSRTLMDHFRIVSLGLPNSQCIFCSLFFLLGFAGREISERVNQFIIFLNIVSSSYKYLALVHEEKLSNDLSAVLDFEDPLMHQKTFINLRFVLGVFK